MGGAAAAAAGAARARAQRRVMSYFMSRNAVSAEQAVTFTPDRHIEIRFFEQMQERGVIKPGRNGGYYLDIPAYDAWRNDFSSRKALILIAVLIAIGAGLLAVVLAGHSS